MKIKLERSGGFAGMPLTSEFNIEDLPAPLKNIVTKIIENKKGNSLSLKSKPSGAADHYNYKISIMNDKSKMTILCDQYDLQGDLKILVKQLEKFSKKR